jgi:hypothetical protein
LGLDRCTKGVDERPFCAAVPTFYEGLFFFASWLGLPKPWCPST